MDPIGKLSSYFLKFPGIGARQARRFVYHLLTKDEKYLKELADSIITIKEDITECTSCHRFFSPHNAKINLCALCSDQHTDRSIMMIVEKDVDLENVRKSGAYQGRYFVLGGTLPFLNKDPNESIRARILFDEVEKSAKSGALKEVIVALSANPEGEHTTQYVTNILEPLARKHKLKITMLGRGLSTGTELEYSDSDTLKSALKNRG